jgi:hypothetical protein
MMTHIPGDSSSARAQGFAAESFLEFALAGRHFC